jgi:hypothetical protein
VILGLWRYLDVTENRYLVFNEHLYLLIYYQIIVMSSKLIGF